MKQANMTKKGAGYRLHGFTAIAKRAPFFCDEADVYPADSPNQIFALRLLAAKMSGRKPHAMRTEMARRCLPLVVVHRDPVCIAYRWLRRFVGGIWYRAGSHVARLNFGPGIGFEGWNNDRKPRIKPVLIHMPAEISRLPLALPKAAISITPDVIAILATGRAAA